MKLRERRGEEHPEELSHPQSFSWPPPPAPPLPAPLPPSSPTSPTAVVQEVGGVKHFRVGRDISHQVDLIGSGRFVAADVGVGLVLVLLSNHHHLNFRKKTHSAQDP